MLEQVCSGCGLWEAAGSYCSRCALPTGSAAWYRNGDITSRRRLQRMAQGLPRPPAHDASSMDEDLLT